MGMKMKDYYNIAYAKMLGNKIKVQYPEFKLNQFLKFIELNLDDKPFLKRQDLFVDGFDKFMTHNYKDDLEVFGKLLGPELETPEGMFKEGWWLWPIGRYIERHGLVDRELSILFIYELTKRYTGEFAIRPLLNDDPKATLEIMIQWSMDPAVHVRRLASEGMRINLPWSKKSVASLEFPELFRKVLDNLKEDQEKFVMKSVGNNLNDLMKERPELAEEIINDWQKDEISKSTAWIIQHGLRSRKK